MSAYENDILRSRQRTDEQDAAAIRYVLSRDAADCLAALGLDGGES